MFNPPTLSGLRSRFGGNKTGTRYFLQGKGEIKLSQSDFKAQGGEGSIYVKKSTAYKIYADPSRTLHPAKIVELSALTQANIIRPLEIVLNAKNEPVGYSMHHVDRAYALCQLFPKAFRQRNNLTPELTLLLVRRLQQGVAHVHSKGILIVDLNEMNFLVAADFGEIFFIDVDSYQTPSFAATSLMESVRDRHAKSFSTNSDWFAFAVVSFQMFVGVHPFKGSFPPLQQLSDTQRKLDARMLGNISVLHKGVSVPMSCFPFSLIPPVYLDWYRAVFEEGKRLPPPNDLRSVITLQPQIEASPINGSSFLITEAREYDSLIISHDGLKTITQQSIYFEGKRFPKPSADVKVAVTPRQRHLIAAYSDASGVKFCDLTTGKEIETTVKGEQVAIAEGNLFIKQAESIFQIDFIELQGKILIGVRQVANVMMRSTQMFNGLAIQNLLGANYASILRSSGKCFQVRLPELDGHMIIDAKLERNVLIVVIARGGNYDKLIYRFASDFSAYDVRLLTDVMTTSIDFTVLDTGVVLHLIDENELEIFSTSGSATNTRSISDPALEGDVKLFHTGKQALIARDNKLFRVGLRP
jgi:hypothetical protein